MHRSSRLEKAFRVFFCITKDHRLATSPRKFRILFHMLFHMRFSHAFKHYFSHLNHDKFTGFPQSFFYVLAGFPQTFMTNSRNFHMFYVLARVLSHALSRVLSYAFSHALSGVSPNVLSVAVNHMLVESIKDCETKQGTKSTFFILGHR